MLHAIRFEVDDATISKLINEAEKFVVFEHGQQYSPLSARNEFDLKKKKKKKRRDVVDEDREEGGDNLLASGDEDDDDEDDVNGDDDLAGAGKRMNRDVEVWDQVEEDDVDDTKKKKKADKKSKKKAEIKAKAGGDDDRGPLADDDDDDDDFTLDDDDDDVEGDNQGDDDDSVQGDKDGRSKEQKKMEAKLLRLEMAAAGKKQQKDEDDSEYGPEIALVVKRFPQMCSGKEPMLYTLHKAGIALDRDLCAKLPPWKDVVDLYGDEPVVVGLETCQQYRDAQANKYKTKKRLPKLAGLWNTGSTALSTSFLQNFVDYDPRWEIHKATVPWGKHTPLWLKYINKWPKTNADDPDQVLPVVVVRDPFRWMNTMVRALSPPSLYLSNKLRQTKGKATNLSLITSTTSALSFGSRFRSVRTRTTPGGSEDFLMPMGNEVDVRTSCRLPRRRRISIIGTCRTLRPLT